MDGHIRRGGLGRGPTLLLLPAAALLLLALASPASAVVATVTADGVVLGSNVTVKVTADQCLNASTCTQAIVAVNGKVVGKPSISEDSEPVEVTVATGQGTDLPQSGSYRVSVWIVSDTVSNATATGLAVGASVGDEIDNKPPDATAAFFVSPATMTASISRTSIVAGESVDVTGSTSGIATLGAWVFDKKSGNLTNGKCLYREIKPGDDADGETVGGSFTWTLDRSVTTRPGEYTVFLLSPGPDNLFQKTGTGTPPHNTSDGTCPNTLFGDGSQVLSILKDAADPLRTDDTYRVFTLRVEPAFLRLDPIGVAFLDDTLTVSGRTNSNGTVLIRVFRTFFEVQGTPPVSDGAFSASFSTAPSNDSARTWEPGTYTVTAEDGQGNSDLLTFELVQKRPAEFQVSNLVVLAGDGTALDGRKPSVGQELTAQAVLVNRGEAAGNVTLYFQLSGRTLCAPTTAIEAGSFALVNCTFTVNHTGAYTLQADGRSIALDVLGPTLPEVAGEVKAVSSLPAGAQARLLFTGPVERVDLTARSAVSGAQVAVQRLDARPDGLPDPPGVPFAYFRLSGINLPESAVGTMFVVFRVDGEFLSGNRLGADTVRLYRASAPPGGGAPGANWRIEPEISPLGTDNGGSDTIYQARVTAFGDFAIVGGSTEGVLAAPGEAGPLDLLTNIPLMAAIAGGAGASVFLFRRWRARKRPAGAPGAPEGVGLPAGEAAALPATFEGEALSLFQSGQPGQAFRRIFDEVAAQLSAALALEGILSSGELLREAEAKNLDPGLLTTIGQLFATCDAARFSGIPPTEEHLRWALRAARAIIAQLSGATALPSGGAPGAAAPPGQEFTGGGGYGEMTAPSPTPPSPPSDPGGGYEAAGPEPPYAPPPAPPRKNGNGNNRRRRRRRKNGGNGNGNGNGRHRNGNGNGNGPYGNGGNGNGSGGFHAAGPGYGRLPVAGYGYRSNGNGNGHSGNGSGTPAQSVRPRTLFASLPVPVVGGPVRSVPPPATPFTPNTPFTPKFHNGRNGHNGTNGHKPNGRLDPGPPPPYPRRAMTGTGGRTTPTPDGGGASPGSAHPPSPRPEGEASRDGVAANPPPFSHS